MEKEILSDAMAEIIPLLDQYEINDPMTAEIRILNEVFRNDETGYSIYDVENSNFRRFKITGYFPVPLKYNTYYVVEGLIKSGKYGRVLQALEYRSSLPKTKDAILMILRNLPWMGDRAKEAYDLFGTGIFNVIFDHPDQIVAKLKYATPETVKKWREYLQSFQEDDLLIHTLQEYQIPIQDARRLIEKYPDIVVRLKDSPYFLLDEIRGFGFAKCDKIALKNGYDPTGQERVKQAMLCVLRKDSMTGNCYMELDRFMQETSSLVDIQLDFPTARAILSDKNMEYPIYDTIDREKLQKEMRQFQSHPSRRFHYMVVKISHEKLQAALSALCGNAQITLEENRIYLETIYQAESYLAKKAVELVRGSYSPFPETEAVMNEICCKDGIMLEDKQKEAVLQTCSSRGGLMILNGQAGCGKTFTLNIIVKVLGELYRRHGLPFDPLIMAPTGQAARVAHNSTGLPAQTIHRALHLVADGKQTNTQQVTITSECVIIDEFSMVGVKLASKLFQSLTPMTKVIMMGDYEQLPSIEPGNVLKDLIYSNVIPVVTLNVVKRQAQGSGILHNANEILAGRPIRSQLPNHNGLKNNAYLLKGDDPVQVRNAIVNKFLKLRQMGYGLRDLQILCPQKNSDVGVHALNYAIQSAINSNQEQVFSQLIRIHNNNGELATIQLMLKEGDKVVNTSNNYKMKFYNYRAGIGFEENWNRVGIVNGEIGRIAKIDTAIVGATTHKRVYVRFGNEYAMYEDDWSTLSLAYAMTIHRAQGSQWPVVIAPIMRCNQRMLNRKILYTLYTRASTLSIIYGTSDSISCAIDNVESFYRKTRLKERLKTEFA